MYTKEIFDEQFLTNTKHLNQIGWLMMGFWVFISMNGVGECIIAYLCTYAQQDTEISGKFNFIN